MSNQCTVIAKTTNKRCRNKICSKGTLHNCCSVHYPLFNPIARCRVLTQMGIQCANPICDAGQNSNVCLTHLPAFNPDIRCKGITQLQQRCRNGGTYNGYCHHHRSQEPQVIVSGPGIDFSKIIRIPTKALADAKAVASKTRTPNTLRIDAGDVITG